MHEFDFINRPKELLTPEVVALLTRLHECRGRAKDNIWIERFCKTKKIRVYLHPAGGKRRGSVLWNQEIY